MDQDRTPKPTVLRSRRGVALLLAAVLILAAVLYVATGATAFLRAQNTPPAPAAAEKNL